MDQRIQDATLRGFKDSKYDTNDVAILRRKYIVEIPKIIEERMHSYGCPDFEINVENSTVHDVILAIQLEFPDLKMYRRETVWYTNMPSTLLYFSAYGTEDYKEPESKCCNHCNTY
jgi:hypothetical protein